MYTPVDYLPDFLNYRNNLDNFCDIAMQSYRHFEILPISWY